MNAGGQGDDETGSDTTGSDATASGMYAGAELPPGSVLAGRFRIERMLGIGGMGVVYLAIDQSLGVPVAIKLLRPELASRPEAHERFRQELLFARQVSSPHVVRIHDIAHHEGRWLISMDYVDGEPLDKLLDRNGALTVDEALRITRQLALGLAAAHARDVVHRDLKPSNVLIDAQGNAYISDFGIARSLGASGPTRSGVVVGTPDYLSPEQARAQPVDARSDLYALGLLLYEMLAGQPAFGGGTSAESLHQRLVGPPPPIRKRRTDAPAWVQRLLDRMLRPNPAHRLQTADAIVEAIDRRHVPRDFRPGRRSVALLLGGLLVAGLVVLALWWRQEQTPAVPPPDRIVVLPIENATGNPTLDDALAGYAEHLRQGLDALPDVQVVDGERTAQALAQLGLPDTGVPGTKAVLRALPAQRVLRARLEMANNTYRMTATLSEPGAQARSIVASSDADPLAAGRDFAQALARTLQPDADFPADIFPSGLPALTVFGNGLRARRAGDLNLAIAQFSKAADVDPHYPAAWLALAEAAHRSGRDTAAASALKQGLALHPSNSLRDAMQQWQALIDGDTTAVVAALATQLRTHPDDLDAELRMASLQGEGGDPEAALKTLGHLARRDDNDPRVAFLLGKYSIMHGDLKPAVDDYLVRALVLYKRGRNAFGEAETVNALGVGYSRLGQTVDAEEQYRKAVELRRALGDRRGVASSLRNLAQMSMIRGHFDESKAQLQEARGLFEALGDAGGIAAVDNEIGLLAEERGRYPEALDAFRLALHGREQLDDRQGVAESLNNIGFAHYQLGAYDSAQVFWKQSLDAFGKVEDGNGVVRVQQNLGLLDTALGRWDSARKLLQTSLASAEAQQMAEEAAVSRRNLAELELVQGHLAAAGEQLQRANALFKDRGDERGLADTGLLAARIALAADDLDGATNVLTGLAPTLAQSSDEQRAGAALLQAEIAQRQNRSDAAMVALVQAGPMALASGVKTLMLQWKILHAAAPDPDLASNLDTLDNLPLKLSWLRRSMDMHLRIHDAAAAVRDYRQAQSALHAGDSVDAFALHLLGANALDAVGDSTGSAAARRDAQAALAVLQAAATPAQRKHIDSDPEVARLRDTSHAR
jgi:tetratricopeptide (TPR) repeat protein